ncbi:hypothetical protein [Streptacidiphilus carbonis]|uniref:hypothetical protein n=1 Tax=Streptacidiphilus carbonis TaxID=105422 RepID=UPI0005A70911|nr:hypothetical protein [Streptacidiphilus carbonis]
MSGVPRGGHFPPVPPPPAAWVAAEPSPEKPTSRKGRNLALAVAGWLVIASGTATGVVLVGDGGGTTQAAAAALPSASASPSAAASSSAPVIAPAPTAAPSPSSTVKGSVNGSTHSGDLRFFLLPVPADAEAYGDSDGSRMSIDDVAKTLGNPSTSKKILNQYGCAGGAYRSYRSNDGTVTVNTQLLQFDGSGHAGDWASGLTFGKGKEFSVSGIDNGRGIAFDPATADGDGELLGISHVGDVEYEITVTGTGKLAHSLLTPLMKREEQRLSSGR